MSHEDPCARCEAIANEGGWCGVCGNNLLPEATYPRFSLTAQDRESMWKRDPEAARALYEERTSTTTPSVAVVVDEDSEEEVFPDPKATKVCPECAEEVKAAAKVCRFCSHRFDGEQTPPAPQGVSATTSRPHALPAPATSTSRPQLHPLPIVLVLIGAATLVVALLLPYAETPPRFTTLVDNTVLKHGEWQYLIGALLAPALLFWIWRTGSRSTWLIWQGVVMLAWSVYDLIDKASRTYTYIDQSGGRIAGSPEIVASPGAGLYVATLGSILVLAGGLLIRFPSLTPNTN